MSENKQTISIGSGFTSLLTVLFIGLKLTHVIDWSWWWVLAPMWLGLAVVGAFMVLGVIIAAITFAIVKIANR